MNSISLLKRIFCVATLVFVASCDRDFNDIGGNVVDGDIHSSLLRKEASIIAYDKLTGPVQSNNLTVNTLGFYKNPVFGTTTANFVTQLELETVNPTLYTPVIDSVYIYVPYQSTLTAAATTTAPAVYELQSVYGDTTTVFTLDIVRNGYFLRDSDAASGGTQGQKYYSGDSNLINGQAGTTSLIEGGARNAFKFSPKAIQRKATYRNNNTTAGNDEETVETLEPGIFLPLNKDFFTSVLFGAGANGKLLNNTIFKEYFRGIYFKATQNSDAKYVLATPNFSEGVITVKYTDRASATDTTSTKRSMTLNLAGNTVNLFTNEFAGDFITAAGTSDNVNGDSRLYLKGGEGSAALLDIKMSELSDLLPDASTGRNTLINEANLVFYVDHSKINIDSTQPTRIYLYDVKNRRPLYDYYTDATTVSSDTKLSKYVHGGILDKVSNTAQAQYKIRITDHINNLINKDSTNVKIGLVVTQDINTITSAALKAPWENEPWMGAVPPVPASLTITSIPTGSVINPFGTVLYGNNIPASDPDYNKRLKLEIYYTKPD